ncbi:MAG: hypothetical protein ACFFDK_15210 [Promethearchaeota archaeon]
MEHEDIYPGNYIIINGNLRYRDGKVFGKEGEILAALITITFKKEVMERLIESQEIDPSKTILDTELDPEEYTKNEAGAILIKKKIKDFKSIGEFKPYLSKIKYQDF